MLCLVSPHKYKYEEISYECVKGEVKECTYLRGEFTEEVLEVRSCYTTKKSIV